jgi:hypothetical protein
MVKEVVATGLLRNFKPKIIQTKNLQVHGLIFLYVFAENIKF